MAANTKKDRKRNPDRKNGKAWKQRKGVSPNAHNGKTVDGYSPRALARRASVRPVAESED